MLFLRDTSFSNDGNSIHFNSEIHLKNIIPFRISPTFSITAEALTEKLSKLLFTPCSATQTLSSGFVDPVHHEQPEMDNTDLAEGEVAIVSAPVLVRQCGDALVFSLKIEKKSVASGAVKHELNIRAAAQKKSSGFAPGSKWKKEAKEQIILEMLPNAFPSSTETHLYIDLKNKLLVVGTASEGLAENVASTLRRIIDGLDPFFFRLNKTPSSTLSTWISTDEPDTGFTVDMDGELRRQAGGVIKFSSQSMTANEVRNHLNAGYVVEKLALTWEDRVSMVVSSKFIIQKIKSLLTKSDDGHEDREAEFLAEMTVESSNISLLIAALVDACDGEAVVSPVKDRDSVAPAL